jgi:acyl-CoA reductase-like NAD-dependent aldehyde dehydrogenase
MDRYDLVIGGERVPAVEGTTFIVDEPARGRPMAEVARAGPEDVRRAVATASTAFEEGPWPRTPATVRGRVLLRVADLVRERLEDIARVEARNAGKPIADARGEIEAVAGSFEYFAGAANKVFGETIPVLDPGLDVTIREPVGVCALIVPWNFPLLIATWKIAPALACGNTIVVKPASFTPLSVLMLAEILLNAGVPPAAVSVLPGPGGAVGSALVSDPRVSKVSFTGSTEVGAQVLGLSAPNITRVSLELGGKSANVVFADADLDRCVPASVTSVFGNCGQDCCARSRVLVERPIYEEFVEAFAKHTSELRVGQPLDEQTEIGPMISEGQRGTTFDYLRIGQEEGARLVTGGSTPEERELADGWFVRPAVLADVDNRMRVAREEIFGPVAAIIRCRGRCRSDRERQRLWAIRLPVDQGPRPGHPGRQGDPDRRPVGELQPQRPRRGAVRWVQEERDGARDGYARPPALHRGEERLLQLRVAASSTPWPGRLLPWPPARSSRTARSPSRSGVRGRPGRWAASWLGSMACRGGGW